MSKHKGYHKRHGKNSHQTNFAVGERSKEIVSKIDENNRVMKMFSTFSKELDEKHDRYERIVKLGRDITIESKRIIFALHSTSADIENKRDGVFEEIGTRLQNIVSNNFKQIALELEGQDPYLYHRSYTNGMQEFIEALVFYQYLKNGKIDSWTTIKNNMFHYVDEKKEFSLFFSYYDFILGIADFTGELMRRCINNLGVGNIDDCFKLCDCVRYINEGFLGILAPGHKEISRKIYTLKQSLMKMELVCYNLKIRGSEIPKHMLAAVLETHHELNEEEDEGFF